MKVSKHFFKALLVVAVLCIAHNLSAQRIQYGGKNFTNFAVLEGSIGDAGKHLEVYLAEHALPSDNANALTAGDNLKGVPDGYYLQLEVSFPDGVKFPILPEDEVLIETSDLEANVAEEANAREQFMEYDQEKVEQETKTLRASSRDVAAKTKEITKKMQSGELSPEEAVKQIQALTQPLSDQVEESTASNLNFEEMEAGATFSIKLLDTKNLTESTIVSGRLFITRFDENTFEALLNGEHVVECMERLAASSAANEARCSGFESGYVKGLRVMSEGTISININVPIKSFNDGR